MKSASKPYIVVAEDDKSYGRVYFNKLTAEGYDITLVNNGAQVVPTLLARKPQLLVLDLIMPGLDGFGVLEKIRSTPELQDLRVLVASNLSQEIDRAKVAKYNVYGYFIKSDSSINEVIDNIKKALES